MGWAGASNFSCPEAGRIKYKKPDENREKTLGILDETRFLGYACSMDNVSRECDLKFRSLTKGR